MWLDANLKNKLNRMSENDTEMLYFHEKKKKKNSTSLHLSLILGQDRMIISIKKVI